MLLMVHRLYNVDPACRRSDIFGADGSKDRNGDGEKTEESGDRSTYFTPTAALCCFTINTD